MFHRVNCYDSLVKSYTHYNAAWKGKRDSYESRKK
jgi:hypothetical protein